MTHRAPRPRPDGAEVEEPTLLEQMGGLSGVVATTLPILVLVPVNAAWGLAPAMIAAVAVAIAIFVWRILRKETIQPAVSGLFGVLIGAAMAFVVGDAKGFFLYGIWYSAVAAVVFAVSMILRWPAVGVVWEGINGRASEWRGDKRVVRAYDIATTAWMVVFAARFFVQNNFYEADDVAWLGVARVLMGWPLTIIVLLITVLAVRSARADEDETESNGVRR